jgi:transposase
LLGAAPDPARAAALTHKQIAAALSQATRRNIDAKTTRIQQQLRADALCQPTPIQTAYAAIITAQVQLIGALNIQIEQLGQVVAAHFGRHRDAERYLSLPGLGTVLSARILGEFGDDPNRYTTAKARKNYAGTSPITRASGNRRVVIARYARNRRLGDAVHQWAFCSLKGSPGARTYYKTLRDRGISHQAALRQLGNRLVGILHGCLKSGTDYDETTAWAHHQEDLEATS